MDQSLDFLDPLPLSTSDNPVLDLDKTNNSSDFNLDNYDLSGILDGLDDSLEQFGNFGFGPNSVDRWFWMFVSLKIISIQKDFRLSTHVHCTVIVNIFAICCR